MSKPQTPSHNSKLRVQDLPLAGKKVLIRVDFNVPLNKDGSIADDTRIRVCIPTIELVLKSGAAVILMGHLGNPQSKNDVHYSMGVCAKRLAQLIVSPVLFATDCVGKDVDRMIQDLKSGQVLLLENLRFYPAEAQPELDPNFAKELAKGIDYYVNEAFASAHRDHTSTARITQYFPGKAAMGLHMQEEISHLAPLLNDPKRPFYVLIGGAKVATKMGLLQALIPHTDAFFIGGGMALSFLQAQGINTNTTEKLQEARSFMQLCHEKNIPIYLPSDLIIADRIQSDATYKTLTLPDPIPENWYGVDIGPLTLQNWQSHLHNGATFFWNGPMGVYELPPFAKGTEALARYLSTLHATTIIGGGDSVAAIHSLNLSTHFTHLSTGGGASLAFLESGTLPGITALTDK